MLGQPSKRPASAEQLVRLLQALVADGITIPRTIPEVMQEVETTVPVPPVPGDGPRAHPQSQPTPVPRTEKTTLAGELSVDVSAGGKNKPLLAIVLIALVILALLAVVVAVSFSGKDADPVANVQTGQTNSVDSGDATGPTDQVDLPDQDTGQQNGADEPKTLDAQQVLSQAFVTIEGDLAQNDPVAAWSALQQVSELAEDDADWFVRYTDVSQRIVSKARTLSSASLSQSVELMQAGKLAEAIDLLERDKKLAEIAGIGDRYQQVMESLRNQQEVQP